jgi:hypothetical protein
LTSNIVYKETDLRILTDKPIEKDFLAGCVRRYRGSIENYIAKEPRFLSSLKPLSVERGAPLIVRSMAKASVKASVGPMASVAGAIAQFVGKDILKHGCSQVIVENGGDIFLSSFNTRIVSIYCGDNPYWKALKLKIRPLREYVGICCSSGKFGHSLSFGNADAVAIIADDCLVADACATAVCNRIKEKKDLTGAVNYARSLQGVLGVVALYGDKMSCWGGIEFSGG